LVVLASSLHKDRTYKQRTGNITLVVSLPDPMELPKQTAATTQPAAGSGPAK